MAGSVFEFGGHTGHRVSGRIESPEGTPRGWAIFAHCFMCGKDGLAATRVTRALSRAGIGVLRFDFAGVGDTTANGIEPGFAADVGDLVAASAAMTAAGMPPSLLIGHSLGGAAALAAATGLPDIAAVATIAAPADLSHVLCRFGPADLDRIQAHGEAEVVISGRPFVMRRSFLDEIGRHDIEAIAAALHRPLLVMHAPRDEVVGIDHASRLFLAAKHPKSFISLDTADHLLTELEDANYVASTIAAWAARYLPQRVADLPQVERAQGVVATETGAGLLQVRIEAGDHEFVADEPASVGGMGSGPSPYELVSAGLAACTVMTVRLYAQRKGLPLRRARAVVEHAKITDMTPSDRFTRTITLEGPLDEDQRARILAIADRCPVDLTLVRGADIQTHLAGSDSDMPSPLLDP